MSSVEERAIQGTDKDAIEAKAYAVKLGYWEDNYIQYFNMESKNKTPEINRGYFARTKAIENITKEFIMQNERAQIISIGAGSDTLHFRLLNKGVIAHKFIELDLAENVCKKIGQIAHVKLFHNLLGLNTSCKIGSNLCQNPYYLFPMDLRTNPEDLIKFLQDNANIDLHNPTLFIAECVFVYILPEFVDLFLETVSRLFGMAAFLSYDPINMKDAFGAVMIRNLKMRNIELRGISAYENKETISERYKKKNFTDVKIWSISEVYKSFSPQTLKRIESIEMLDDPEMMKQLFDHYCLILSTTVPGLFINDDLKSLLSSVI